LRDGLAIVLAGRLFVAIQEKSVLIYEFKVDLARFEIGFVLGFEEFFEAGQVMGVVFDRFLRLVFCNFRVFEEVGDAGGDCHEGLGWGWRFALHNKKHPHYSRLVEFCLDRLFQLFERFWSAGFHS